MVGHFILCHKGGMSFWFVFFYGGQSSENWQVLQTRKLNVQPDSTIPACFIVQEHLVLVINDSMLHLTANDRASPLSLSSVGR